MKIITWNCNMAFRKKWEAILAFQPDLLILQECEQEIKYKPEQLIPGYNQFLWIGDNPNKGVGILSFNNYHIKIADHYQEEFKYIVPIKVTGAKEFNLFAIWAMPHQTKSKSYVGRIWEAVHFYQSDFNTPSILIGDWNSNAQWDHSRKHGNHTQLVEFLRRYHILSLYHELKEEAPGQELEPTIYLLKQKIKPFHLDYCFASQSFFTEKTTIDVGHYEDWIKTSDHMPLIVDFT